MVEQFGLAMMLRLAKPRRSCGFTSGTTSGTSGSMRNWLVLSITTQPCAAARGAWIAETEAPGLNRPISQPVKSNVSRLRTVSTFFSPKEISEPVGPAGGERDHFRDREVPLHQGFDDLASDCPCGADNRDPVSHDTLLFETWETTRPCDTIMAHTVSRTGAERQARN